LFKYIFAWVNPWPINPVSWFRMKFFGVGKSKMDAKTKTTVTNNNTIHKKGQFTTNV
jgi:hypothetical protein